MSQPLAALLLSVAAKHAGRLAARALLQRIAQAGKEEPGEVLKVAIRLREEADEVLARAVVYERARGTSWAVIGATLGVTRQSAFNKFRDDEDALKRIAATSAGDLEQLAVKIERLRESVADKQPPP